MEIYQNLSLEDLPNEEWRDVVGYEGLYQVSNLGRVKSLPKLMREGHKNSFITKEIIMKPSLHKGYVNVNLYKDKKMKRVRVHRIEIEAFLGKEEGRDFVDHINGIRYDNRIENLRWCTHKENDNFELAIENTKKALAKYYSTPESRAKVSKQMKERYKNKEYVEKIRHRFNCKPVLQYDKDGNFINEYYSAKEAERQTKITRIDLCCRGGLKTAGGYIWKYKQNNNQ